MGTERTMDPVKEIKAKLLCVPVANRNGSPGANRLFLMLNASWPAPPEDTPVVPQMVTSVAGASCCRASAEVVVMGGD